MKFNSDKLYVLDNIIPEDYQDFLLKCLLSKKNVWSVGGFFQNSNYSSEVESDDVIDPNNNIKDKIYEHWQFNTTPMFNGDIDNQLFYLFLPLLHFVQKYFDYEWDYSPHRVKANLQFPSLNKDPNKFTSPHVDLFNCPDNAFTFLYYVNNSDGNTFIFNEKYDGTPQKNFTLNKKISPKKGRIVMFKGDTFHSGSFPINSKYRLVVNINSLLFPV